MEVDVHHELTGGGARRGPARGLFLAARSLVVCLGVGTSAPALAITLNLTHSGPSVVGEAHSFTASAGPDTPSDEDASAEAARSQDFRRFTVTLDSSRPRNK